MCREFLSRRRDSPVMFEDLEKRPVKKQNYDTDGDTDQDAHQDGGAVAAAGTVQFFSADILSGEAGNGDVKALGRGCARAVSTFSMAA